MFDRVLAPALHINWRQNAGVKLWKGRPPLCLILPGRFYLLAVMVLFGLRLQLDGPIFYLQRSAFRSGTHVFPAKCRVLCSGIHKRNGYG